MGLFDLFKKKPPVEQAPIVEESPEGWDAITAAFEAVYPGQTAPPHRAPKIARMHDLSEKAVAFDGVSAYDAGEFWHLITYGLTELYGKESDDPAASGFGYELTFRIPKLSPRPPLWAFEVLEAIGSRIWGGMVLGPGHAIQTGPLDGQPSTSETGIVLVSDPALPRVVDTPNGSVEFLLMVGVPEELRAQVLQESEAADSQEEMADRALARLKDRDPNFVTPISHLGHFGP